MELIHEKQAQKGAGFVVNTLTTANQRATSKSSAGSSSSFVQKLAGHSKLSMAGAANVGTPSGTQQLTMQANNYLSSFAKEGEHVLNQRSGSIGQGSMGNMHGHREASTSSANIAAPKVISCNYKQGTQAAQQTRFDYSSIQALMANLKQQSSSTASTSSGPVAPKQQYARSTSRGKDSSLAQASKLSAMLGRPNALSTRGNTNSAVNVAMSMFHPRPQNLRVKVKGSSGTSEMPPAQLISATQRTNSFGR